MTFVAIGPHSVESMHLSHASSHACVYVSCAVIGRQILDDLGMYMTEEQFKELCSRLQFTNGHMNYVDFVANFEDPRHGKIALNECSHMVKYTLSPFGYHHFTQNRHLE